MRLVFEVCAVESDKAAPWARKVFDRVGGVIGRGSGCDWVIPDSSRLLSSHHGLVGYREGRYFLTDISRNGIGVAGSSEALRKGNARLISDGDVFELGALAIRARLLDTTRPPGELRANTAVPIPDDAFLSSDPLYGLDLDHQRQADSDDLAALSEVFDEHEPWADSHGADREHVAFPRRAEPVVEVCAVQAVAPTPAADEMFWAEFAAALGVGLDTLDKPGREVQAIKVARLFRLAVEGLQQSLRTREELISELDTASLDSRSAGQNPLQVCRNTDAALAALLDTRELGQVSAVQAVAQAHRDLQVHQVGMLAACRSSVRNARAAFEPGYLLSCFEFQGKQSRFFTDGGHWRAYQRHYQRLVAQEQLDDRPLGGAFAKAYEEQVRLISTLHVEFSG